MSTHTKRIAATTAALTALALTACSDQAASDGGGGGGEGGGADEPITIGIYAPLTGETAEYGETFRNAYELFQQQINDAGGIDGRQLELLIEDDRGDPAQAANIAQQFVDNSDVVATVGSFSSAATMAAAPVLERAGIPNVSPSSSHPDYTRQGEYLFRNVNTQAVEGELNAEFMYESVGSQSAGVAHRQDDFGVSAAEHFTSGFESLGGSVPFTEAIAPETRDFRSTVTTISNENLDALYVATFYSDAAVLSQQMASTGLDLPVLANSSLFNPELIELGGDAVEGWYVATNFLPTSDDPAVSDFVADWEEAYGSTPDQFAALAYDSLAVLAEAVGQVVEEDGSVDSEALRDALYEVEYTGPSGTVNFDEEGDVVKEMTYLRIEGGEFVPVED